GPVVVRRISVAFLRDLLGDGGGPMLGVDDLVAGRDLRFLRHASFRVASRFEGSPREGLAPRRGAGQSTRPTGSIQIGIPRLGRRHETIEEGPPLLSPSSADSLDLSAFGY